MGAQYQLVHSGQLYGCMKMARKFVQATQFSNVVYLQTAKKKTYLAVHLTSGQIFFENLLADRKAVDSTPKYSLLAGDTNQAYIFSPSIKCK